MRQKLSIGTVVSIAVLAPKLTLGVVSAHATTTLYPLPPGAPSREVLQNQANLLSAVTSLEDAAQGKDPAFFSDEIDPDHNTLIIFEHGTLAASSIAAVATAQKSTPFSLELKPVAYSMAALQEKATALMKSSSWLARGVNSVTVNSDGSGLSAMVDATKATKDSTPAPDAVTTKTELEASAGVPVTLESGSIRPLTRWADSSPWYGGAGLNSPRYTNYCSTGFAAKSAAGTYFMTTDAHCNTGSAYYNGTGATLVGNAVWDGTADMDDTLLIGATGTGRVYDGAWDNSAGYSKPVSGLSNVANGSYVCTSGAWEGIYCSVKVTSAEHVVSYGNRSWYTLQMTQQQGQPFTGPGDSGGSVFSLSADGSHDIVIGTIAAGDNEIACANASKNAGQADCASVAELTSMHRLVTNDYPGLTFLTQ